MVVAPALWFARLVVGLGRTLPLIALVALGADVVWTRRAVVLPVAIVIPEIAAGIGTVVSVAEIAVVIVATRVIRVVSEAFAAIIAAYGAAIPVMKIAAVIVATSVISMIPETVAAIVELAGARRRCDVRAAVIERGELRAVVTG